MICAIITTYHNAGKLADVISHTARYIHDIIVVDDNSDEKFEVLRIKTPVTIVHCPLKTGKGYALKQGLRKAIKMGFSHALTIDCDGQHSVENIPLLLTISRQQPDCFIVENRTVTLDNSSKYHIFAEKFCEYMFTMQTSIHLPYIRQSGMHLYPLNCLHGLSLLTSHDAELELLVFAAWAGEKIVSVPIQCGHVSKEKRVLHFSTVYDFFRITIVNSILCLVAVIYGLPRRWWRSILYGPWFMFCWIIGLLVTFCCKILHTSTQTYRKLFHYGASILIHTFPASPFRIQRKGGYLPMDYPAVYIANHTSLFDILAVVAIHPNLTIIAQNWVFNNPFFAPTAHMAGFLSVSNGFDTIVSKAQEEVESGASVLIFPEGGRSQFGILRRFHRGAFKLTEILHLPIQPVVITGMFKLMSKGELYIGKSKMIATLMPAIMPDDNSWGENGLQRSKSIQRYYEQLLNT